MTSNKARKQHKLKQLLLLQENLQEENLSRCQPIDDPHTEIHIPQRTIFAYNGRYQAANKIAKRKA
jgi:hypothetical protein